MKSELKPALNSTRRTLLRGVLSSASLSVAVAAGLLRPQTSLAWGVPAVAAPVKNSQVTEMLQVLRNAQPVTTDHIQLLLPTIAEDGASVFMECACNLPEVDAIAIFVDRNPQPLAAAFVLAPEVLPEIRTRLKLSQTSNVWVVARSQGKFYKTFKKVVVSVGGCGVGLN